MRAMILRAPGGLERLELVDRTDPGMPVPGEVRVRIHATSLNYHDLLVAIGAAPTQDGRVPMADGAGVIEAVGDGVTSFELGDSVVSGFFPSWLDGPATIGDFHNTPGDGIDGFAQQYVTLPATAFTHAPAGWSHAEAATITTAGLTAWRALVVEGGIKPGDSVLTLGTGGVSIYALQLAKAAGARVVITSSSDEKLDRARALGADHTINYLAHERWGAAIREWTGGRGVDHVVETGGPGTLAQSIEAVRIGGHIALIGVLTGRAGQVPIAMLMARQSRLQGLLVGSRREQQDFVRALDVSSSSRPVIDRCFAMPDLASAFAEQQAGRHFGKICATWE